MEVLQRAISSVNTAPPQPHPGMFPGNVLANPAMPGPSVPHPAGAMGGPGYQVNHYDMFKVKNVTGLVSQALHQVSQIKQNYSNLRQLKQVCSNLNMQNTLVHRQQMDRLQILVTHGTQELHAKIQLINDAIARFQASPLAIHPMYTNEVNKSRQTLYRALEELRLIAGGQQSRGPPQPLPQSSGGHMPTAVSVPPNIMMVSRAGNGQTHVTSTTDFM